MKSNNKYENKKRKYICEDISRGSMDVPSICARRNKYKYEKENRS